MTPQQCLDEAAVLMAEPPRSMRRCWQRGSACLTRIALEQTLQQYWRQAASSVVGQPMRNQLIVMRTVAGASAAARACSAWYGLSRAMHHHTYELAPTIAELRGWHQDVTTLLSQLEQVANAGHN